MLTTNVAGEGGRLLAFRILRPAKQGNKKYFTAENAEDAEGNPQLLMQRRFVFKNSYTPLGCEIRERATSLGSPFRVDVILPRA